MARRPPTSLTRCRKGRGPFSELCVRNRRAAPVLEGERNRDASIRIQHPEGGQEQPGPPVGHAGGGNQIASLRRSGREGGNCWAAARKPAASPVATAAASSTRARDRGPIRS